MFDVISSLLEIISKFIVNFDNLITAILTRAETLINLIVDASDTFLGIGNLFPFYLTVPLTFIFGLVLVLRVWGIITSGG